MVFFKVLTFVDLFAACQIAQVQPRLCIITICVRFCGLNQNLKYCMRTTTLRIHWSLSDEPVLLPLPHQIQAIAELLHLKLSQALHKNTIYLRLMNVQCFRCRAILQLSINYLQQIVYLFVVNLQKRTKQLVSVFETFVLLENRIYWSRNDTCKVNVVLNFTEICHLFFVG